MRAGQAALLLAATYFLARVIGLFQLTIINALLPPGDSAAYFAAFRLPDIINYLVAGGAMSVTFIPIFTSLKHDGNERAAWKFFSTVASLMGVALAILIALGILFADPLVRLTNPGFNDPDKAETLALTIEMTRVLLPAQLFFYLGGMVVGVLNAHRRFGASGLTGAVYNLVAIAAGVLLWKLTNATGFAWGILIGAFAGNFLMPLLAARSGPHGERLRFDFCFEWQSRDVQRFFLNALPIMLGVSLPVVDQIVVGWFASYLPVENVAYLQTGNRVMLAPLGILAQAASVAAFPFMASDSAARNWQSLADFVRNGLRRLMFLSLAISTLLILIARPLVSLLFGYGKFGEDRNAVSQTAVAFAFYCVGLFAWAGQQFVARGFYALQDTKTPTIIGTVLTFVFFIPLCWLMKNWNGVLGLSLATSIGATAHFICVLIALDMKMRGRKYNAHLRPEKVLGTLLRTLTACLVMGAAGLFAARFGAGLGSGKPGDVFNITITSVVAVIAFSVAASAIGIPEWKWISAKIARRR